MLSSGSRARSPLRGMGRGPSSAPPSNTKVISPNSSPIPKYTSVSPMTMFHEKQHRPPSPPKVAPPKPPVGTPPLTATTSSRFKPGSIFSRFSSSGSGNGSPTTTTSRVHVVSPPPPIAPPPYSPPAAAAKSEGDQLVASFTKLIIDARSPTSGRNSPLSGRGVLTPTTSAPQSVALPRRTGVPAVAAPAPQPVGRAGIRLRDFELGVTLGTGSFGRVRFARYRHPLSAEEAERRIALKILKKKEVVRQNQVEHIESEKTILCTLSKPRSREQEDEDFRRAFHGERPAWMKGPPHPFVVRGYGTFQDSKNLYVALEFVRGGEFFTHLRTRGHLKNDQAKFYTASVACVFAHLHSLDVVYRDLKPENLLLDHRGYLKVTDFGFAKHIPEGKTFTLCGTPEYLAPEILLNQGHGKGVDWWALGVLTYEMLSGRAPFVSDDTMEIYKQIVKAEVPYPAYFDPEARAFLRRLLQRDLTKRFGCLLEGARDVCEHSWLSDIDYRDLLSKNLKQGPPILPKVGNADDTTNFEDYPESDGEYDDEEAEERPAVSSLNFDVDPARPTPNSDMPKFAAFDGKVFDVV